MHPCACASADLRKGMCGLNGPPAYGSSVECEGVGVGRVFSLTFFEAIFLGAFVVWVLVLLCDSFGAVVVVVL